MRAAAIVVLLLLTACGGGRESRPLADLSAATDYQRLGHWAAPQFQFVEARFDGNEINYGEGPIYTGPDDVFRGATFTGSLFVGDQVGPRPLRKTGRVSMHFDAEHTASASFEGVDGLSDMTGAVLGGRGAPWSIRMATANWDHSLIGTFYGGGGVAAGKINGTRFHGWFEVRK